MIFAATGALYWWLRNQSPDQTGPMLELTDSDALASGAITAIHAGDVAALESLLREQPGLATAASSLAVAKGGGARTLLHIVTDFPGNYPNGAAIVATLIAAGADVNARFGGAHTETPLHWAASCDDVAVLDKLLDLAPISKRLVR